MIDELYDTDTYERIKLVLKEFIPKGVSPDDISPDTRLLEDLNIDSARVVELVLDLETAFSISIEDELIGSLITVGDVISLVKQKTA